MFDPSAIIGWAISHLVNAFVETAILEALGLTAVITLMVARFTDKLKARQSVVLFSVVCFIGLLITISSFGTRVPKPDLHIDLVSIGSAHDPQGARQGTDVFVEIIITNRGTVPAVAMRYDLSAEINGQIWPAKIVIPALNTVVSSGNRSRAYSADQQLTRPGIFYFTGIPYKGFVEFHFDDLAQSVFSNFMKYRFTVTDSFGQVYELDKETHGELTTSAPDWH